MPQDTLAGGGEGEGEIAAASGVRERNGIFRSGGQNHWESGGGEGRPTTALGGEGE